MDVESFPVDAIPHLDSRSKRGWEEEDDDSDHRHVGS